MIFFQVNKAFNDLKVSVASFPGLSYSCLEQLNCLNCEVINKLNKILEVNETESNKDIISANTTKYVLEYSYNYILIIYLA